MTTIRQINFDGRRAPRTPFFTTGPDMAVQSEKDACDVNKIVERALRTGIMPVSTAQALYADVSNAVDYQSAVEMTLRAQEQFDALPVKTRNQFDNDVGKFLAFAEKAENKDAVIELVTGYKKPPVKASTEPDGSGKEKAISGGTTS